MCGDLMNADLERVIALQRLDSAVDAAKKKLADEPDRERALDARLDAAKQHVADAKARLSENQGARRAIEKMAGERAALVSALPPEVLSRFEQVAKKRNGVAVAEAKDGICTICHVRLRPQVFNTVRRNEEIVQCDSCQRILYFVPAPAATQATT